MGSIKMSGMSTKERVLEGIAEFKKTQNLSGINFDYEHLYDLAEKNKEKFQQAKPFPHVMFDNFLDEKIYTLVRDNHEKGKLGTGKIQARCARKYVSENSMHIKKKRMFYEFGHPDFIKFLNILTGIDDLALDANFLEGGYTTVETGGHLQVHKDFTHNRHSGLERRLNFFIYLNDDWQEEWGSSLSLWDIKTGNKVSSYLPIGNRCVIFQASNISYHGHPEPLRCPKDVVRKSFGLYYYTKSTGIPEEMIHFLKEELNG